MLSNSAGFEHIHGGKTFWVESAKFNPCSWCDGWVRATALQVINDENAYGLPTITVEYACPTHATQYLPSKVSAS